MGHSTFAEAKTAQEVGWEAPGEIGCQERKMDAREKEDSEGQRWLPTKVRRSSRGVGCPRATAQHLLLVGNAERRSRTTKLDARNGIVARDDWLVQWPDPGACFIGVAFRGHAEASDQWTICSQEEADKRFHAADCQEDEDQAALGWRYGFGRGAAVQWGCTTAALG